MEVKIKSRADWPTELFTEIPVTLQIRDRICGGIPKDPDVIRAWITAILHNQSKVRTMAEETKAGLEDGTIEAKTKEEMGVSEEDMDAITQSAWNGFKKSGELFIEGRQVKAMLKESANILSKKTTIWALKSKIADHFFVSEDHIPLGVTEPSGYMEGTVHVTDRYGEPQSALKRTDYVSQPQISFTVKALDDPFKDKAKNTWAPAAVLELLLEYAQELGLGAERSQGYGKFTNVSYRRDMVSSR